MYIYLLPAISHPCNLLDLPYVTETTNISEPTMSRNIGAKRRYSAEILAEAAKLVQSGSITLSSAARSYGIPKTTLYDAVKVSG